MQRLAELPRRFSSNVAHRAGLASRRRNTSYPPNTRSVHSQLFPNSRLLLSATPHVSEFPHKPPPHTAQTFRLPLLLYENCSTYTSSDRTVPARRSRALSSHKNSSTSIATRAPQLSFFR